MRHNSAAAQYPGESIFIEQTFMRRFYVTVQHSQLHAKYCLEMIFGERGRATEELHKLLKLLFQCNIAIATVYAH